MFASLPDTTVSGYAVKAVEVAMGKTVTPILQTCGINTIVPDHWYDLSLLLDVLQHINQEYTRADMLRIGMTLASRLDYTGVETLPEALFTVDGLYQQYHNGAIIGGYEATWLDTSQIQMEHTTPYPGELEYGLLSGIGQRFRPANSSRVHVEWLASPRRRYGDGSCMYIVSW